MLPMVHDRLAFLQCNFIRRTYKVICYEFIYLKWKIKLGYNRIFNITFKLYVQQIAHALNISHITLTVISEMLNFVL